MEPELKRSFRWVLEPEWAISVPSIPMLTLKRTKRTRGANNRNNGFDLRVFY